MPSARPAAPPADGVEVPVYLAADRADLLAVVRLPVAGGGGGGGSGGCGEAGLEPWYELGAAVVLWSG